MNLMVLLRELYEKLKKSPRFGLCWLLKKLAVRIGRVLEKRLSPVPMAPRRKRVNFLRRL